jgi:hypothetical protein
MPAYSHPTHGPLNLATLLPWYTRLPDLGPKGYIAFGREAEHEGEGDSVTKMHEDLSGMPVPLRWACWALRDGAVRCCVVLWCTPPISLLDFHDAPNPPPLSPSTLPPPPPLPTLCSRCGEHHDARAAPGGRAAPDAPLRMGLTRSRGPRLPRGG